MCNKTQNGRNSTLFQKLSYYTAITGVITRALDQRVMSPSVMHIYRAFTVTLAKSRGQVEDPAARILNTGIHVRKCTLRVVRCLRLRGRQTMWSQSTCPMVLYLLSAFCQSYCEHPVYTHCIYRKFLIVNSSVLRSQLLVLKALAWN